VKGRIALHGGGEFLPGDEAFLRVLLETIVGNGRNASGSAVSAEAISVAVVPIAAARGRPELVAEHARQAFERVARELALDIDVRGVFVIDAASAADPDLAARLAAADLIYLPGGDPDLVLDILPGSPAWQAAVSASEEGALIAGASAGAMSLARQTWTPTGWREGLGLVDGLIVVPHFAGFDRRGWEGTVDTLRRANLGQLGIDERTGVISSPAGDGSWQVAGTGRIHWFPPRGEPLSAVAGESIDLGPPILRR
jgi:cyanophycinase-like exopeptidase